MAKMDDEIIRRMEMDDDDIAKRVCQPGAGSY